MMLRDLMPSDSKGYYSTCVLASDVIMVGYGGCMDRFDTVNYFLVIGFIAITAISIPMAGGWAVVLQKQ